MSFSNRARTFVSLLTMSAVLAACGPKDEDIKADANKAVSGISGASVDVVAGVATISGQVADEAAKASADSLVKAVKGVKSVVNNATVTPPPAPVVISPDDSLRTNVAAALTDYPTLTVEVKDGVVTLGGEIKKADLPKAMQALSALHPKKIENKAKVTP